MFVVHSDVVLRTRHQFEFTVAVLPQMLLWFCIFLFQNVILKWRIAMITVGCFVAFVVM